MTQSDGTKQAQVDERTETATIETKGETDMADERIQQEESLKDDHIDATDERSDEAIDTAQVDERSEADVTNGDYSEQVEEIKEDDLVEERGEEDVAAERSGPADTTGEAKADEKPKDANEANDEERDDEEIAAVEQPEAEPVVEEAPSDDDGGSNDDGNADNTTTDQRIDDTPDIAIDGFEAGAIEDKDSLRPRDERLDSMDSLDVFGEFDPAAAGGVPGDDLGPQGAGGVPGVDLDDLSSGGVPGDDFDPFGAGGIPGDDFDPFEAGGVPGDDFNPFGAGGVPGFDFDAGEHDSLGTNESDPGSIGLGGDVRTGWDGQDPNATGEVGGQSSPDGNNSSDGGSDFGGPAGANRSDAGDPGTNPQSGQDDGSGSWTGITSWYDSGDSNGNQQIDGYEEYHQEDGTTLIIETHHDDENGTTQTVTLYDEDGNVIEEEKTHEPADNGKEGEGGGSEGAGSGNGEDSGASAGSESGSEEGGAEEGASSGADDAAGADDSRPNPYADAYDTNVDVSLTFSNEELTTPTEPGGSDATFGAERLVPFGNGIVDPRTINPAPDGAGPENDGSGDGDLVGEGIVDPVGPGFLAGDLGLNESFASMSTGQDDGLIDESDFDPLMF